MAKRTHLLRARFSEEEEEVLQRAVARYNEVGWGQLTLSDLIRKSSLELSKKILMAKKIEIMGMEK